jgi:putative transposase
MLTQEELIELCESHQLTDFAIAVVKNIRASEPSRNVRSGACTELAALFQWDHDRDTYEFYDQPPRIKKIRVDASGRERSSSYTPDFFVLAKDFIGWVECKDERWLRAQEQDGSGEYVCDEQGVWRCPAAERYADSVGLGFRVRSSSESDPIVVQNIADLSDYYRSDCPEAERSQLAIARTLLGADGWCWLRDLLQNGEGLTADAIFKMIADEQLHVNLRAFPIMNESHRVRVFKSQTLLESSQLWLPSCSAPLVAGIPQVALKSGIALLWDGQACEILNVGDEAVYLRKADKPLIELPKPSFELMVKEGVIIGAQEYSDPRADKAARLLRKATASDFACALRRYYSIHPELCPQGEAISSTERARRKWRAKARAGTEEFGNEFVALLPTISLRGNRNSRWDTRTQELMDQVIEEEVMSSTRSGYFIAWSLLKTRCEKEGLLVPSRRTFANEIRRKKSPEDVKKAREGEKAGYGLEMPYLSLTRETPKHGCRPFDIAHIDHTQLDLQFVDESYGRSMKKAWLTVLIDAYTRVILAWIILFDPPSYRSCMLVVRDCVQRHQRFPKTIVADQGSDFKSKYFDMLIAYLGSHKRMRPASKPHFGSIIERFFGLNNTEFVHALRGNNQALQSPRSMSASHNPVDLAVWNLRAFREAFEGFLKNCYHAVEHPALGVSPDRALELGMLQSGARTHTLITYGREFVIATMPTTEKGVAKIRPNSSFKANRIEYFSSSLPIHVGTSLEVKYDPFDVSRAYVMGPSGWIEGVSNYAGTLAGRSEKEMETISTEINELNGRTGLREAERASLLGNYIDSIRNREGSLAIEVQAARDREQRLTYAEGGLLDTPAEQEDDADAGGGTNVVPLKPERPATPSPKKMQHDVFENGTRKVFGDFE